MLGEVPYMIVWGFFSAMGWMAANWVVDKNFPDKQQEKPPVIERNVEESKDGRYTKLPRQENSENKN